MSENQVTEPGNSVFVRPETLPVPEPFRASGMESLCAALIFIPAYLYVLYIAESYSSKLYTWCIAAVAVLLVGIAEVLHRNVRRSMESNVWLLCFAAVCYAFVRDGLLGGSAEYELQHVWYSRQLMLFIHIFIVWWILARSGKLAEGQSGHLLPLDALNGFIVIPFSNFFLKIRSLWYGISSRRSGKKTEPVVVASVVIALGICLVLYLNAVQLLSNADATFSKWVSKIIDHLSIDLDDELLVRIIFTIPVSSWLFGLIAGSVRTKDSFLEAQRSAVGRFLSSIRKVPAIVWTIVIGAFSVLYLVFFVLQGSYLFGAFTCTLPEGFIVSQYARQGFFELCQVMALNFALLWMVTRMSIGVGRGLPLGYPSPAGVTVLGQGTLLASPVLLDIQIIA